MYGSERRQPSLGRRECCCVSSARSWRGRMARGRSRGARPQLSPPGRWSLELYFSVRGPARSPRAALRAAC